MPQVLSGTNSPACGGGHCFPCDSPFHGEDGEFALLQEWIAAWKTQPTPQAAGWAGEVGTY
jgi:hypothetical protein